MIRSLLGQSSSLGDVSASSTVGMAARFRRDSRRRKKETVRTSPSASWVRGSQPSHSRARVMSGCRCVGSSWGSGRKLIRAKGKDLQVLPRGVRH